MAPVPMTRETPASPSTQQGDAAVPPLELEVASIQAEVQSRVRDASETYEVSIEPNPELPIFHASAIAAVEQSLKIVSGIEGILRPHRSTDPRLDHIYNQFEKSLDSKYPKDLVVGVIGDSGVGKSTLINSLLNSNDLCPTSGNGDAGTSTIREYSHAAPDQVTPYKFQVTVLEEGERLRLFKRFLCAIDYHKGDTSQEGREEDLDEAERDREYETAVDGLRCLFPQTFQTPEAIKSKICATEHKALLELMAEQSDQILSELGFQIGILEGTADSADELADKLYPFESCDEHTLTESTPSRLWPIVGKVTIRMNSKLLSCGIKLVDLPGLSDSNKVRKEVSHNYRQFCDSFMLVAPCKRIKIDEHFNNQLHQLVKVEHRHVIVVGTHSDAVEFERTRASIEKMRMQMPRFRALEAMLGSQLGKRATKRRKTGNEYVDKLDPFSVEILEEMGNDLLRQVELDKIQVQLRALFEEKCGSRPVPAMFLVSSKHYLVHAESYVSRVPMSVEHTQIPRLRQALMALPAKSRFETLDRHCRLHLEQLFAAINCINDMSAAIRNAKVEEILRRLNEKAHNRVSKLFDDFSIRQKVSIAAIKAAGHSAAPEMKKIAAGLISNMVTGRFTALMRNRGIQRPKNGHRLDVTASLSRPLFEALLLPVNQFDKSLADLATCATEDLCQMLEDSKKDLQSDPVASTMGLDSLVSPFAQKQSLLRMRCGQIWAQMKTMMMKIREMLYCESLAAHTGNFPLDRSMMIIYNSVLENTERRTLGKVRKARFLEAISSGQASALFPRAIEACLCKKTIEDMAKALHVMCDEVFGDTYKVFKNDFAEKRELSEEVREVLKRIGAYVKEADADLLKVCKLLDEAKAACGIDMDEETTSTALSMTRTAQDGLEEGSSTSKSGDGNSEDDEDREESPAGSESDEDWVS